MYLAIRELRRGLQSFVRFVALLLIFSLFVHINFLTVLVDEFVVEESETLIRDNLEGAAIVELPTTTQRDETLVDVGGNEWVNVKSELLDA